MSLTDQINTYMCLYSIVNHTHKYRLFIYYIHSNYYCFFTEKGLNCYISISKNWSFTYIVFFETKCVGIGPI